MNKTIAKISDASSRHDLLRSHLHAHPLYSALQDKNNLKIFMEHHVYAVWDFMSLIKSLQHHIAPTKIPWIPPMNSRYANFINQLVLEEESDKALTNSVKSTHASHFESYLQAMLEIGADIQPITRFIEMVNAKGFAFTLNNCEIPGPAKQFMTFTFNIIDRNQPHLLAAVLAFGREDLVPQLFRFIQTNLRLDKCDAPNLYAYLERHIQLDEQEHSPLAIQLTNELCKDSREKYTEAMQVAEQALMIRLEFCDGILAALKT